MRSQITVDSEAMQGFCRRNHIRRLALFGSVLRDDFTPQSDVDVLVEFEPGKTPDLMRFVALEREAAELFNNRKVDLVTFKGLSRYIRDRVLSEAEVYFAA